MELWSAFLVGFVGSLHCAGMCGPLALALPAAGPGCAAFVAGRIIYNLGRITSYCLLGVVFGLVGKSLALVGLQRWASLAAGVSILVTAVASSRYGLGLPAARTVAWLKAAFASLLKRRTLPSLYLLGTVNGLLPCGLVYAACATTVALGSVGNALSYMLAFGLGTLPMMLGLALLGQNFQFALRLRFQKLIPLCLLLLAALLILRGLSLGIPFVSPNMSSPHACH
jgi:sulfite exporter TauE/SafE